MPFDALVAPAQTAPLSDALARHGIRPVPLDTLDLHKQAQLKRFGPSFWYRHRQWLAVGLLTPIGGTVFGAGFVSASPSPSPLPAVLCLGIILMCSFAGFILSGLLRLRAGSHWEERWLPADWLGSSAVPDPIAATARMLQNDLPGSTLILGELVQESVVVDPYLLLDYDGQRICLGIWDEGGVIALAGDQPPRPTRFA
jgi:hypothetical protein